MDPDEEPIAEGDQALTAIGNGTCAVHYQLAAEVMRAAMLELGRYRPGLDLVKSNGFMALAATTPSHPDLDGDGQPDGAQRCAAMGGCTELTSLLAHQHLDWQAEAQLSGEFPWMSVLQPGEMANSLVAGVSDALYPHYTQVMPHHLKFDHVSTSTNSYTSGCGGNFKYHCFSVSGLPPGKTVTNLRDNIVGILMNDYIKNLTHLSIENNMLCIDPDGGGGDTDTVGSTGAATCYDGSLAMTYQDSMLGACCTKNAVNGVFVRHPTVATYMVCKTTDAAAAKPSTADSVGSSYPVTLANDSDLNSHWSAADYNANHYWKVDLGASVAMKGALLRLETSGLNYGYRIETSPDNLTWTAKVDRTSNTRTLQYQDAAFSATARYARVVFTSLPPGRSAAVASFRVFTD